MSLNPEEKESDLEVSGSAESEAAGMERNAAEALDGIETEAMAAGHTVRVGSDG